jgi:ABC-type phosphate/phosphonate transport system substrate-binding protein
MRQTHVVLGAVVAFLLAGLAPRLHATDPGPAAPGTVSIGLVQSMFRDVPAPLVQLLMPPFRTLMRAQTGLDGQLVTVPDAFELGSRLQDDKVQLGVFHGFEFAWARQKFQDLRPLCIVINRQRNLYAYVMVKEDSPVKNFADLKGKAVALPLRSREHCRLYLERLCAAAGQEPERFLGQTVTSAHVEAALDDVLRGKVQAAVVDGVSLECYRHVKPGCGARLRVLSQSEIFPAAVVAYRQGALDAATLNRFKNGMITANQNERGRDLMSMWKVTAFEAVPADYEQTLTNVLRAYPPPAAAGAGFRPVAASPAP